MRVERRGVLSLKGVCIWNVMDEVFASLSDVMD